MYLQRIEEAASSAFLSPEEEGELVGKVYGKARAHRTARLERERRRRKLAVDQEVAKGIAEIEHAAAVDWANIQVLQNTTVAFTVVAAGNQAAKMKGEN